MSLGPSRSKLGGEYPHREAEGHPPAEIAMIPRKSANGSRNGWRIYRTSYLNRVRARPAILPLWSYRCPIQMRVQ